MTIETELNKLQNNLANSYASCENKGATMPSSQNFDNLATTIDSIETGGGGSTGSVEGAFEITASNEPYVVLPGNTVIKEAAFKRACCNLKTTKFSLWDIGYFYGDGFSTLKANSKALQECFKGNTTTTDVDLAGITTFNANDVLLDCFVDSVVTTISFIWEAYENISSQTGYSNKWGAPTATIKRVGDPI